MCYRGRFASETIQHLVIASYESLPEHARIRAHLVVLAEHPATERLDALARIESGPGSGLARMPFECGFPHPRNNLARGSPSRAAPSRVVRENP